MGLRNKGGEEEEKKRRTLNAPKTFPTKRPQNLPNNTLLILVLGFRVLVLGWFGAGFGLVL